MATDSREQRPDNEDSPASRSRLRLACLASGALLVLSGCYTQLYRQGYAGTRSDDRAYGQQIPAPADSLRQERLADSLLAEDDRHEDDGDRSSRVIVRKYYSSEPWPWDWDYPYYSLSFRYSRYRDYYGSWWDAPHHHHRHHHHHYRPRRPHRYPSHHDGHHGGSHHDRPKRLFPESSEPEFPRQGRKRGAKNLFGGSLRKPSTTDEVSPRDGHVAPGQGRSSTRKPPREVEQERSRPQPDVNGDADEHENGNGNESGKPERRSFPSQGRRR